MVLPTHLKRRRLAIALCLGVAPSYSWAAADDWNCARSKDNQQWECNDKSPSPSSSSEAPARAARPVAPPPVAEEAPAEAAEAPVPELPATPAPEPVRASAAQAKASTRPIVLPVPAEPAEQAEAVEAAPEEPAAAPAPTPPPRFQAKAKAAVVPAPQATAKGPKRIAENLLNRPAPNQPAPGQAAALAKPRPLGWDCKADTDDQTGKGWACDLEGPDPKGMARVMDESGEEVEDWTQSSTITREDETRFQRIAGMWPVDPWKNACAGLPQLQPMSEFLMTPKDKEARATAPLDIHSNHFELVDGEVANFSGNVEMVQADQKLWADFASRDLKTNTLNTHGSVFFQQKGMFLASDTAFLDNDTGRGVFRNSQFLLPAVPGRGTSRLTHFDSNTLSRYETVTYTTCPPGNQAWLLHADHLKINKESGQGTVRNAWFTLKDVPVFYTPYMTFPTDQRRQSGLLAPTLGFNRYTGFNFALPYYFNLAPNYDYTFVPRYMSDRGIQLKNQFRYLTGATRGLIEADIVPYDDQTKTTRGQVTVQNNTRFSQNLVGFVNANYVSDYSYLGQLGTTFNINNRSNIPSLGYLAYTGDSGYSARMQIDYFQTIDPTIPQNGRPYFHLPQFAFNYSTGIADTGLMFDSPLQMDNFQNSGSDPITGEPVTTGQRLKLRPRLYYPFQTAAGYITPSFALQNNQYWLQNPEYWAQTYGTNTRASESLTVPITSIDSGAYFERDFEWSGAPMTQTLEPRLFYAYVPYQNQNDLPVFDSISYDYTFYQLFRENRYTGSDRVGDTNQLSMALTTRLIDQSTGRDRVSASLGSAYYFSPRRVTLGGPPSQTQLQNNANLIGDFSLGITQQWSFRAGGQWNPNQNTMDRGLVALQYNDRRNNLLNVAYRYRRNQYTLTCEPSMSTVNGVSQLNPYPCLDLTDVSLRLPVAQGWHLLGRWQYSLIDNLTLQTFVGFQRETCCWRLSLVGYRNINNFQSQSGATQANNGIYFQLELKGLTSLGDSMDDFLRYQISGYRQASEFSQDY